MATTLFLQKLSDQLTQSQTGEPDTGRAAAQKIIEEYFDCYSPAFANNQLWILLTGAISNDLMEEQTGAQRHNCIFFFEYTQLLIRAVYHLHSLQALPGVPTPGKAEK